MIHQKSLQDLTESYLRSLISEVVESLSPEFDSFAPFGELGVDSFHVLKTIRKLEASFGTLPKSLLFENFNINDLANYFVGKHEQTLCAMFAKELEGAVSVAHANGRRLKPVEVIEEAKPPAASRANTIAGQSSPIRILEKEAYARPELQELVQGLFDRFKIEGCVSRGTRKIAPNLFIGGAARGYFNYGRSKDIILVYGYTGPRDYWPALLEEMRQYCETNNFQLNILTDEEIQPIDGVPFSATPFGVLQRVKNLKEFSLEGGAMRRLRYQVSKFQKSGVCKTEEYQCGSDQATDKKIVDVIDKWRQARTMVNPLVHDVKAEILAGALGSEHRLFLTYLDDVLQNVILITAMSAEENGYLMDLEFYPPDMPMGGLEFAIAHIIEVLAAEGCDVLSLGGTYGCKLESSVNADPEVDRILDDLRAQNIFNDAGNLQFKNKFRPETRAIYLCRPVGSGNPDNVIDIIMMIADPLKALTSDEENHNFGKAQCDAATFVEEPAARRSTSSECAQASCGRLMIEGNERSRILSDFGFNPLNIPPQHIEFDLKTDSWAQLETPAIQAHVRRLHAQLQRPANVDESLRAIFPFAHFVLTESGQAAESALFKAWPKKGIALQNLLFPSTIFHEIDKGFTPREAPHPEVFRLNSREQYKGDMAWDALRAQLAQDPSAIALVCIEVSNNASGGHPVSMRHLRDVKALLAEHSIPLVIDGARIVENAQFLIEQEEEYAGKSVWAVAREMLSYADVVIGSLTKDFLVNKGGLIATNDVKLFQRLQDLVCEEGAGVDLIDRKLIALSLQNRKQIEAGVLRRMEDVGRVWRALVERKVPVAQPAGGHSVLIDVKQIPEFKDFKYPVASFLAWMYLNAGIRASAHSVGMQKQTPINDLVRLAIPVGLERGQIDIVIERLINLFDKKANIPEIVMESEAPRPLGAVFANYKPIKYHNASGSVRSRTDSTAAASPDNNPATERIESAEVAGSVRSVTSVATLDPSANRYVRPRQTQDIAVIGMAGRYPKAKNLGELWDNLAAGRDCIEEIPAERYERRLRHGNFERYRGGFIDDVDKFDSLFFNISPREAEMLDPQERLFLEVAWEAIEDAGYYPETLAQEDESRNIGVFVGAVWAMYQMLGVEERYAGNKTIPNSFLWSIANRVSYCLNLSGPSLTIDTACSSSLTAIYLACEAIYAGQCSAAIVGGVNLDLHQAKFDINWAGGALSADGVCRSFGKDANGYVAGEGVGALFLKPLDRAAQDGDNIYGVIKSAVVNHGGRTSGYTVPNPKAQTGLILSALEKANIDARSVGYIEAHGTGTALGDPVEITGLGAAFKSYGVENQTCAIGSIKSNIGHLEAAAGVVSVSKALLQMKYRQLAPSLHCSELNEFIDFPDTSFYVVQRLEEWKNKEVDGVRLPLRAGVSSFGAGGSNAHVILEHYEPVRQAEEEPAQSEDLVFPVSARNEDQLQQAAIRLRKFLQQNRVNPDDVAYTLQHGRKSFEHRLAIVAGTIEGLIDRLTCFIDGKRDEDIATGQVKGGEGVTRLLGRREKQEFIRLVSEGRDPRKIAGLWSEGLLADWQGFQSQGSGKRISLPTYPFADKRHWACDKSPIRLVGRPAAGISAGISQLIDANESTFERQLFKKTFDERDFFIHDHRVSEIPTLPGVAYLELARKAGELAAGRKVQKIRNILWVSPIAVQNSIPKEVFIELKPTQTTVRFEVFSNDETGAKTLHSQGTLLYAPQQEAAADEYIDLESVRARCAKVIDGEKAYPLFKSFGLNLGPSFQTLRDVYKNDHEALGVLRLPEFRHQDLESLVLHPSLVDGSLQAGMAAHLGDQAGEMLVPYSIGEVEILHPLQPDCFSYVTESNEGKKDKGQKSRVLKSDVMIVDQEGKVLVKIRESAGVPLRDVHKNAEQSADGFSALYYSYEWEKAAPGVETAEQNNPTAVVFFDAEETLRDLYRQRLRTAGTNSDHVILVRPGESFQDLGGESYTVNPQDKDDFGRLFDLLIEKQCAVENICFAWRAHEVDMDAEKRVSESLERGVYSFLFLCQSLIQRKLDSKVKLLYLYSGSDDRPQEPHNEAMGGFVNALRLEHPRLLCKTLEVRHAHAGHERILDAVSAELRASAPDATAVRYEAQERYIRKLKAFNFEEAAGSHTSPSAAQAAAQGVGIREKGVYLITGGAGGLGFIFAEFLAKESKARLVLTGRSELSVEQEARLDDLRKSGAEALYLPADVSNYEDVKKLVEESKARFGEINGIIHSAGVIRDSYIRNKTPEEMSAVFAPKVSGTLNLDEVTKDEQLDFFVTFSSLAAVAGNVGQCDYGFANHFMDSFMAGRELLRAKGARTGKTLSFNWGLWADGGMKVDEQTESYLRKTIGMKPLGMETGLEAFARGLASQRSQFAVVEGVQEKVELAWGLKKKDSGPAEPASSNQATSNQTATGPIAASGDGDILARLRNDLSQIVMEFLKLDAGDVSTDKILLDLGFDSIGLMTFANSINEKYQMDITPVLFFDYPTIDEIAKHLIVERKDDLLQFYRGSTPAAASVTPASATRLQAEAGGAETSREGTFEISKGWDPIALDRAALDREITHSSSGRDLSPELRFVNMPIAIVGASGVMPQSEDLEEFWENLKNSRDLITVIPPDRWRWEDYYGDPLKEANKSNSKWGGFIKEVDKFDPLFFGISPREAEMMDPQQRIFLEHVWKAIEDSGHKVSDLAGTRTGVFVGVATNDYVDMMNGRGIALDGYSASGNSHSVLANRVSFLLNLRGPSAPIDTACSSSLVAMHRAIESIHTGSCEMAIVGGVQVMLSPAAYISFGMAGMLSGDGKCKTFDKQANGYVRGEGCGAVFLKSLAAAEADGNHIYAVIRATAENHGGRVTALTAPNSFAQTELLIEAYEKAQIDPTTVGYIECHGTGTSLGDPIEIQSLSKSFAELYKRRNKAPATASHCGLSSVKTNIGHLETGAGIAGVLKALFAIKHKQIPANIHLEEVNPYINLKGTPFYIADKLTPWEAPMGEDGSPRPRVAGVSSFGFGGANAHVVLEEYVPARREAAAREPQLIALSAKNEDRLRAYAQSMRAYLEKHEVELEDFAYTLQVGRDEMPERLALVASSVEDLKQKFEEILGGAGRTGEVWRNNVRNRGAKTPAADDALGESLIREIIERKELSRLAELWVNGAKIDWRLLHKSGAPRRVSIPTYPFARERYWFPEVNPARGRHGLRQTAAALLHPLVHRNTSTLEEQKFSSRFSGDEFYFADHVVGTQKILPGVAYMEMARAAGELSGNSKVRVIRNLTWESPLILESEAKDVKISLTPFRNEVKFAVRTTAGESVITHCTGRLGYKTDASLSEVLDIGAIRERCSEEVMSGKDLYPFLSRSGLKLGESFQIVQSIFATESESLAILKLPERLEEEADLFWLHPALMDGSLHTAIGLMKANEMDIPLSLPYSVGEVQIFHPVRDLYYGYATWAPTGKLDNPKANQNILKTTFHLLDKNGKVLARLKDFVSKPFRLGATKASLRSREDQSKGAPAREEVKAGLQVLRPSWNPARFEASERIACPESSRILLLGRDPYSLDWVRESYPNSRLLDVTSTSSVDAIEKALSGCLFDQLLWIAPDVSLGAEREGGSSETIIEQQEEGVLTVFRVVKALLRLGYADKELQWTIVTRRTQRVTDGEPIQPAHAGIVGLVGSLAKEYPHWHLRLLDLDSLASALARECFSLPWDKQGDALAHRRGEWFRQGLELVEPRTEAAPSYRKNGVYVVIGGAGGIGEVWSRFMIEHYQANMVWIGRRPYDAAIEEKINSLARLGNAPLYISADATNLDALTQSFQSILKTYPAIHGVVHSAAVLHDQSIARMEESAFRAGLSAKVDISVNLDRVFGRQGLDFMLLFSSIISFFKTPGQSNYSAGCAFKDSFAHMLRQERAYPVKIMNWGYWGSVGAVADEFHNKVMARIGLGSIEPSEGMEALQALVGSDAPQMALIKTLHSEATAVPGMPEAITRYLAGGTPPKTSLGLAGMKAAAAPAARNTRDEIQASRSAEAPGQIGSDYIRRVIAGKLSDALRMNTALISDDAPFADFGVDSIIGVNLVRTISEALQIELDATSLFEYSTVSQLTEYIHKNWGQHITEGLVRAQGVSQKSSPSTDESRGEVEATSERRFVRTGLFADARNRGDFEREIASGNIGAEPIAVIGMSGRFAESESLDAFWRHLAEGKDLVKRVSRWGPAECVIAESAGHGYCSHGSFVDSIDQFDPAFFGISSLEATYMDPQQRLFLEESWKALEDAGYAGKSEHEKQCGVYVGCGNSNYDMLVGEDAPPQAFWGNSQSVTPARIAYFLNLRGPAVAVDTACSSSLVTLHLACQGLWSRETEMALAGGVFLQATPGFYQVANHAGMLSPDGKCYSFDARANGFVPGEGVGVVVLKRLRDALSDGDYIHGVIVGSGVNQNGKSNGLTAPNGRAQEQLERSVYDRFEINPETIQVLEAHGTGSILGDSVEYGAISRAFREHTDKKRFCALGTVKTNIGHTATAAGVASVLKLLLSLKHGQIPPSLHFEKGNAAIDFESGPFYVNTQLQEWRAPDDGVRRAAVSSFSFSGSNAHLVIEEAPAIERAAIESPAYVAPLSARSSEQLKQQARNLLEHLKRTPDLSMTDLSFTLFVGRMHFTHRLACLARDQQELIRLLERWVETGEASQVYTAEIQEGRIREQVSLKKFGNHCIQKCKDAPNTADYLENLAVIAELYVQGYSLDFQSLFPGDAGRIPLPTYSFARERYWVDAVRGAAPRSAAAATAAPPIHANTPNLSRPVPGPIYNGADQDLRARVQRELSQVVLETLKLESGDVSPDKILMDLGFDSISLAKFANVINEKYQLDISPVLFFDYPSIGEIAKYLSVERESSIRISYRGSVTAAQSVAPLSAPERPAKDRSVEPQPGPAFESNNGRNHSVSRPEAMSSSTGLSPELRFVNEPIAIVGIAGVMPQSEDLDVWWENLKNSKDLITVIPEDRWNWEDYFGDPLKEVNKSNSKWGGFMKEIDKFDPLFFGISPREAQMMDPQQRIFLECVWKAIEDSGHKVSDLSGTRTGLFVGVGSNDYADVLRSLPIALDGYTVSGNTHSILANRVSFLLNLLGPSAPIDTACSSSLVAMHRAIESIHARSCEMAIVGGVQVILSPGPYISFSKAGMLSADGKCKTFDKRANGYVRGEGCGAVLLKPLSAAEADGNHIYAVVKATSENHGGRVTTMTAPNSSSQTALLVEAYEKARIDPATVGYIECHGTGTSLGDPIEIQALGKAFSELYKRRNKAPAETPHCGLGSVKTNIGHLEMAAGIAGMFKVLLAIKHRQIPATIHFEEINPYINLKGTPFYIVDEFTPWEAATGEDGSPIPRRAGVSSFGFGGANAHVVLEEYVPPKLRIPAATDETQVIVLSAKNEDRLKAYVQSMRAYLERAEAPLVDLAYTLQVGRDEMPERLALVVSSTEDLKQKLDAILTGAELPQDSYRNNLTNDEAKSETPDAAETDAFVQVLIGRKELSKLAEFWVSGAKIDWRLLHKAGVPRRISIPTYPFARERHWLPDIEGRIHGRATKAIFQGGVDQRTGQEEVKASLQTFVPVWNPARLETDKRIVLPESAEILLLGSDRTQLDWVRKHYPRSEFLEIVSPSSIDAIEKKLGGCSFDQLLWVAPDIKTDAGCEGDNNLIIEQQEEGVLVVFRIIKALLRLGYANKKLQWTIVTGRTQQVTEDDSVRPAHAGIAGLIGSVTKEYPNWNLRLLDVDSLSSVTAQECLSLPWDNQGSALAHRQGEWFRQGAQDIVTLPQATPLYRQNGVYVVIGGAGGIGEVWSRFMTEHYQAKVVWIGRRPYDDVIENKINSLAWPGHAPLYISADATNLGALERARNAILKTYPAIDGVVHSALVMHDQDIAHMEESTFKAGLSAKVDVSVNMDKVFGGQKLDFMLFFSSVISFFKTPGQSSYSAGCMFKDSFAQKLQQERAYPVKVMNWGYWGSVGVFADEFHNKLMAHIGLGSIESHEGMAALEALMNSETRQVALVKRLKKQVAGEQYAEPKARSVSATQKSLTVNGASHSAEPPDEMITNYIRQIITGKLAEDLRIDAAVIRSHAPLQDYGVDSIIGVNLVRWLNEALQIQLESASLFEYNTVNRLTEHILQNWQQQIEGRLARAGGLSQDPNHSTTSSEQVLEMVLLQEALLDDSYVKVTF
jgi:polyketide synthase PksN